MSRAGAECYWPLGAGAARKRIPGAGAVWGKIRSWSHLQKSGAGAAKKIPESTAFLTF